MSFLTNPIGMMRSYFSRGSEEPGAEQQQQPTEKPPPKTTQLKLSDREKEALKVRILECYQQAWDDHYSRMKRHAWQTRQWREKEGLPGGEEGKSNYLVQLVTSKILAKHAREIDALFGTTPKVEATPRGPTDQKLSKRVSLFMTWALYEQMKALKPIALWALNRLRYGRSFARVSWQTKSYTKTTNGQSERKVYQQGPVVEPLNPDDVILPASVEGQTNFDSFQTAEWGMIRYWDTPANMLMCSAVPGEEQPTAGDFYQGIRENWEEIVRLARATYARDWDKDQNRVEIDNAEGVIRDQHAVNRVEILECYIKWRRWREDGEEETMARDERDGSESAALLGNSERFDSDNQGDSDSESGGEYHSMPGEARDLAEAESPIVAGEIFEDGTFLDVDGIRKDMAETDLIVRIARRIDLVVGVQDASEVYPDTPIKRPVFELALLNDGTYWSMSLAEMLQEIASEKTSLVNQVIEASDLSIGPPIAASPTVGQNIADNKWEKNGIIWTANPEKINQIQINPNVDLFPMLMQFLTGEEEDITGITKLAQGRSPDQPNQSRTLGGLRLMVGATDIRLALDMRMLTEDLQPFVEWVWSLFGMFGSESEFFRVAEGDAPGVFDATELQHGWAKLTAKEREADYDFTLKLSDDMATKEAKKQEKLAILPIVLQFPLVAQNPVIQYRLLQDVFEAFGLDFTKYSPEPPPPFNPLLPEEEWNMLLQRQDIHVHPMDNDEFHIGDHENRFSAMFAGKPEEIRMDVLEKMHEHIEFHKQQAIAKQQTQALMEGVGALAGAAAKVGQAGGEGDPMGQLLGAMQGGIPPQGNGQPPM